MPPMDVTRGTPSVSVRAKYFVPNNSNLNLIEPLYITISLQEIQELKTMLNDTMGMQTSNIQTVDYSTGQMTRFLPQINGKEKMRMRRGDLNIF